MILDVHERMQLLQLIPTEGKYEELKTIRRQREMLSFTQEEIKLLNLRSEPEPNGSVRTVWDTENVSKVVKDIPIDEYMTNLFRKKLAELEEKGKLTDKITSIYEKFVIMYR